jgi:hypothetical protein
VGDDVASGLRRSLLNAVLASYAGAGRPLALGVMQLDEVGTYAAFGVVARQEWMCWTAQRAVWRNLYQHMLELSARVRSRVNLRAGSQGVRAPMPVVPDERSDPCVGPS